MHLHNIWMSKKDTYIVFTVTFFILLIPLIAMQFTQEVNWDLSDFVVAGVLLSFFGYLYKVLTKISHNHITKIASGIAVLVLFVLVWASLI